MDMKNTNNDDQLDLNSSLQLPEYKPSSVGARIFRIIMLIVLPIILLGGGIGFKFLLDSGKPKAESKEIVEKPATVDVFKAKFVDIRPTVQVYGETVAGKQLTLRTNVGGEILQVSNNFKSGALVNKGELLFTIDPFNYEGALLTAQSRYNDSLTNIDELKVRTLSEKISLKTSKSLLNAAQKDYDRSVTLRKRGTITTKSLDDKSLQLTQRQQAVELSENNLQAQISQMQRLTTSLKTQQWSIDKAMKDLKNTKVYAPFDAYVQNSSMQVGQLTGTNEQVASLIDRNKMDIVFSLSDRVYGRILAQDGTLIGRKINLIWEAGSSTQKFTATIDRVAAQITASSGGIELYAKIDNVENLATLRVGSFMTVEIPDRNYKSVLRIPEHVVYDGNLIYLLEQRNVVEKKAEGKTIDEAKQKPQDTKAEPKTETRLIAVTINIVGYDGKNTLVRNADSQNIVKNGDVILNTKLSKAGVDILVITQAEAERLNQIRLEKLLKEKALADAKKPTDEKGGN